MRYNYSRTLIGLRLKVNILLNMLTQRLDGNCVNIFRCKNEEIISLGDFSTKTKMMRKVNYMILKEKRI